jgi:hypothetical protein
MNRRWVISHSGIRHLSKGKNYLCNQALRHTGFFVKSRVHYPTCANCLMRIGKYRGINGLREKNRMISK